MTHESQVVLKIVAGTRPSEIPHHGVVAIDTETTGLEWQEDLIGISLAWRDIEGTLQACYILADYKPRPGHNLRLWEAEGETVSEWNIARLFMENTLVFHNLPFDFRVLWKALAVPAGYSMLDTMNIAPSIEPQPSNALLSLYERYIAPAPEWVRLAKSQRKNMAAMPISEQIRYATWDATSTLLLFEKLAPKWIKAVPEHIRKQDMAFTQLVCDLVVRGVKVNYETVHAKHIEFTQRSIEIASEMLRQGLKNPNSDKQVASWLKNRGVDLSSLPLTKGGEPSLALENLDGLLGRVPWLDKVVEYKQLLKGISSWLDDFPRLTDLDGKIHSRLAPFGTVSYRMSSQDMNLQAVPMKDRHKAFGSFMGVFTADREDEILWAFDVKQAEVRLAALLSEENELARAFNAGMDPYKAMSLRIWNTDSRRDNAKQATLASIYEIGVNSFARKYKISQKEAKAILDAFRSTFSAMRSSSRKWEQFVIQHRYVPLISGRKRWFDMSEETYKAFNQRVQGSVADFMQAAMLDIEHDHPGRLRLQIHDSTILQLPRDPILRQPIIDNIKSIYRHVLPPDLLSKTTPPIPIEVDSEAWE